MDINAAVEHLKTAEGAILNCSTQERITSKMVEGDWFVLVESEYEGGRLDRMLLKLNRFARLYAPQQFAITGPVEPLDDTD